MTTSYLLERDQRDLCIVTDILRRGEQDHAPVSPVLNLREAANLLGALTGERIENHLGALIHRAMGDVLRPFLETWQADYRFWWENTSDKTLPPF